MERTTVEERKSDMDLQDIRKELDVIDRELVKLFEKRMDLSVEVAE